MTMFYDHAGVEAISKSVTEKKSCCCAVHIFSGLAFDLIKHSVDAISPRLDKYQTNLSLAFPAWSTLSLSHYLSLRRYPPVSVAFHHPLCPPPTHTLLLRNSFFTPTTSSLSFFLLCHSLPLSSLLSADTYLKACPCITFSAPGNFPLCQCQSVCGKATSLFA